AREPDEEPRQHCHTRDAPQGDRDRTEHDEAHRLIGVNRTRPAERMRSVVPRGYPRPRLYERPGGVPGNNRLRGRGRLVSGHHGPFAAQGAGAAGGDQRLILSDFLHYLSLYGRGGGWW